MRVRLADGRWSSDELARIPVLHARSVVVMAASGNIRAGDAVSVAVDGTICARDGARTIGVVVENNGDGTAVVQLW